MVLAEFLSRLVNQGDFRFDQYGDTVLIEVADQIYREPKEIYWLPNNRVVIRLEEREIIEQP